MKKLIAAVLCAAVFSALFTACGNEKSDYDIVRVWTNDGGGKSTWGVLVDEFNRTVGKEKKVKIEWTTFAGDYSAEVAKAQKKGQLPEILMFSSDITNNFAKTGDILPLEDFKGGEAFVQEYSSITPGRVKYVNGKCYGVYSTSNVAGLIYNKDLFRKAGIVDENGEPTPPKTFDEVREYAKRITDKRKNIYGYSYPMSFSPTYNIKNQVATSARVRYDGAAADVTEYKPMLQMLLDMKKDGSLFPGAESLNNDTSRMYFAEGKIGMMAGISWDVAVLTAQFVADCDWAVAPFPTVDGTQKYPAWHDLSGSYAITKSAKKIADEKIMAVYKFIFSKNTRVTLYENNVRISCMTDVKENADETKLLPQFRQFAEIFDEEYRQGSPNPVAPAWNPAYWKDVWHGKLSLEKMIEQWERDITAPRAEKSEEG